MKWPRSLRTCVVVALCVPGIQVYAQEWKKSLETALEAAYPLTKTGMDRLRITKPGAVLLINTDGIVGDLASDLTYSENKVMAGDVAQRGGFVAFAQGKKTSRTYPKGDKVFVYSIDVRDDAVNLILLSAETFNVNVKGSTQQTRYKSLVSFKFDKATLPSLSAAAVKAVIDPIVQLESEAVAAASAPKTIKLNQTLAEVEATLGKPSRIIDLGSKVTWIYPDMRVVFVEGKVSDIQ